MGCCVQLGKSQVLQSQLVPELAVKNCLHEDALPPGSAAGAELTVHPLADACPPALACGSSPPPGVGSCFRFLQHESLCYLSGSSLQLYQQVFSACCGNHVLSSVHAPEISRYPEKTGKRMNSQISLLVIKSFHTLP